MRRLINVKAFGKGSSLTGLDDLLGNVIVQLGA